MNTAHPLLSKPAPRRTPYCVDCYQNGGKVTVATRMFGDDELCEPHYLALCKDMGVEPEVITLSEAKTAKEIGQPTPIKKIRQAAKPSDHPITRSPDHPIQSFPSDSDLAEAARSLPSAQAEKRVSGSAPARRSTSGRPPLVADDPSSVCAAGTERQHSGSADSSDHPISNTSQRPDSSVAPAAEGLRDRAHSPTRPAPTPSSGVPQTPSAANPQPQPRKEPTMSKCKCGCGEDLKPDTARQFKMGHKSKQIDNLKRLCACGCGNTVTNRWDYINGHGTIASDGAYLVPCQVSEWAMDRIWLKLTPEEKAELLFRLPEAPQKEQQEPAHHA